MVLTETQKVGVALGGFAALAIGGSIAIAASKAQPPAPSPGGEVRLEITPLPLGSGKTLKLARSRLPQEVGPFTTFQRVTVYGVAVKGVPAPEMKLGIKVIQGPSGISAPPEKTIYPVTLGAGYSNFLDCNAWGYYDLQGTMTLSNPIGSAVYASAPSTRFWIGETPAGEIRVGVPYKAKVMCKVCGSTGVVITRRVGVCPKCGSTYKVRSR